MERKELLAEAKQRKKNFLKEMPDDQRRLLLMQQRTARHIKTLLYMIPAVILLLVIIYVAVGFRVEYENKWLINGIVLAVLCVISAAVLLIIRASAKKRMKALSAPIADFIGEYERINMRIRELKRNDPPKTE